MHCGSWNSSFGPELAHRLGLTAVYSVWPDQTRGTDPEGTKGFGCFASVELSCCVLLYTASTAYSLLRLDHCIGLSCLPRPSKRSPAAGLHLLCPLSRVRLRITPGLGNGLQ